MALAFRYLETHKPELEKDYPYTSGTTKKRGECQADEHEGHEEPYAGVKTGNSHDPENVAQKLVALEQSPYIDTLRERWQADPCCTVQILRDPAACHEQVVGM